MFLFEVTFRGQAYDGASNMSGRLNGVTRQIQNEQPNAQYVHCVAHSLNLCLQNCSKKCACIRDALGFSHELTTLIRASPKRLALFHHLRDQLGPESPFVETSLPNTVDNALWSIDSILKNYDVCARS